MKTQWDYSSLATAYVKRADYSEVAIDQIVNYSGLNPAGRVCDVGAGVAHLTLMLAAKGFDVTAVEPNDAMRGIGMERTASLGNVQWWEGTGENTGLHGESFDLVTFGSSFNVTQRGLALNETKRLLHRKGWFACMWNHRNLDDPLQYEIEGIIKSHIAGYSYGTRREDQTSHIDNSGWFGKVQQFEASVEHSQSKIDCLEAWRSHATLHRQAGDAFYAIIEEIEGLLDSTNGDKIIVPYDTRVWMAQLKN